MFAEVDIDQWTKIFEVNVTGTLRGMQTCAPPMKESGTRSPDPADAFGLAVPLVHPSTTRSLATTTETRLPPGGRIRRRWQPSEHSADDAVNKVRYRC